MASYGYPCTGCGSRDCDGCEEAPAAYAPTRCVRCKRFCQDRDDRAGMCGRCHAKATSLNPVPRMAHRPVRLREAA